MMAAVAPSKPPIFLGRNIFYNDEYEELAHTEEQLEALEDGGNDDIFESEELMAHEVMIVGSGTHRTKGRISRVKRYLRCVLIAACITMIIAVGIVTGRHLSYEKYYGTGDYRVRVDALCSPKAVSTSEGLARCRDTCTVASCCVASADDEEENCFGKFPNFCQEYLSCIILHPMKSILSLTLPPAPSDLEASCDFLEASPSSSVLSKTQQLEDCEEACDEAWCCFPSAAEHNCYTANTDTCNGYASCSRVRSESVGPHDSSTNSLSPREEACQPQYLEDPTTKEICQSLCEPFTCCFAPDLSGNMCTFDPKCAELAPPCAILYTAQGTEEEDINPNMDLSEKISLSCNPDHFPSTFSACQELCSGSICCFRAESCGLPESCDTYSPCKILYGELLDIPEQHPQDAASMSRSPISEACQPDLLEIADSRQTCKDLCQSFTCCFVPDPNTGLTCYDSDPNCSNWGAPCGNLFNLEISQGFNPYFEAEQNMIEENQLNESGLSESIEGACDFNHFPESRSDCDELCSVAVCCFESRNECNLGDQCEKVYGPCTVLYDNVFEEQGASDTLDINGGVLTVAEAEKNVYEACIASDLSQQEQLRACLTVCEPATCCFLEGEEGCKGEKLCSPYKECEILSKLDGYATQEPVSSSSSGETSFATGEMVAGGQDGGYDVVIINGNTFTKHEIEKDIRMKCVESDLSIEENLMACETMCESGDCCFFDNENSCKSLEFCDAYAECQVLSRFKEGTLPSDNPFSYQLGIATSPHMSESGQEQTETMEQNYINHYSQASPNSDEISSYTSQNETITPNEGLSSSEDELDKYNTAKLLNALNEVDTSPEATAQTQSSVGRDQISASVEVEDQFPIIDQIVVENNRQEDDEEIFIHGEKFSKEDLMQKLQDACSDLTSEDNWRTCITLCEPADCCHEYGGKKCLGDPLCDLFASCSALEDKSSNSADTGKVFFVDGQKYTEAELERRIRDKCLLKDLSVQENYDACADLCKLGKCCFRSGEKSCKGDTFCSAFGGCKELIL
jgi:hypothetical protein